MLTAHTQSLERELKLRVDRGFRLPRLAGAKLPARVFTSTYYDTDSYRLIQNGLTLRYRAEARSGSWQLKLPVDGARLEVEFAGDHRDPPESLTRLLCAHLRGTPLKPIARLRTRRTGVRVLGNGRLIADVTVDAVDVMRGGKAVRHFDEVEAELIKGDERALGRIEKILRKAGARRSDQRPKVFQALGLAFPVPQFPISPSLPPLEQLKGLVKRQLKQILVHDVGARLGVDPEDVHQMRVAIRRLRAFLRAAQPMLAVEWAEHLREELRWLGDALGKVRDLDVLLAHVRDERGRLPMSERDGLGRVLGALEREHRARRAALLTVLQSGRYLALVERVEAAANSPVVTDPDVSLEEIASAEFRRLRRAVRKGGAEPSDAVLHRIRIESKRTRHAAELAETQKGRSAARFIRRVRDLQDLLGEHHDAIVAEQRLRKLLTAHNDRRTAFILGLLIERQGERRREVRKKWPETWARVRKCGQAVWN